MRLFAFSYGTLSGSNCAEVTRATGFARNPASLEAMTGQIYLAVVVARLVGLHVTPPPRDTVALVSKTWHDQLRRLSPCARRPTTPKRATARASKPPPVSVPKLARVGQQCWM
jgi:hypothetical protein